MYASAGATLLLLSPETIHALNGLYQLVYRLGAELQEIRRGQIDASADHYHSVRLRAVYTADRGTHKIMSWLQTKRASPLT